jgi:hypothetical protein
VEPTGLSKARALAPAVETAREGVKRGGKQTRDPIHLSIFLERTGFRFRCEGDGHCPPFTLRSAKRSYFQFLDRISHVLVTDLSPKAVLGSWAPAATWALVRLTSALVSTPLALTSPMSTPIVPETLPMLFCESITPVKVTVMYWLPTEAAAPRRDSISVNAEGSLAMPPAGSAIPPMLRTRAPTGMPACSAGGGHGNVVPTCALVMLTSVLLITPLAFTSSRKLAKLTVAAT